MVELKVVHFPDPIFNVGPAGGQETPRMQNGVPEGYLMRVCPALHSSCDSRAGAMRKSGSHLASIVIAYQSVRPIMWKLVIPKAERQCYFSVMKALS